MRPLDSREWLEAQRLVALAAGDHATFDHATDILAVLDEQPRLVECAEIITEGALHDGYHDPLLQRASYLHDLDEHVRSVLVDAGILDAADSDPSAPQIAALLAMFVPPVDA